MKDSFSFIFKNLFPILIVTLGLFYLAGYTKYLTLILKKCITHTIKYINLKKWEDYAI